MKSSPNNDWITTMSDESYVKPAWCGTDYIAKVRGREGERGEGRERGEGKKFTITERMSAQLALSAQCSSGSMAGAD